MPIVYKSLCASQESAVLYAYYEYVCGLTPLTYCREKASKCQTFYIISIENGRQVDVCLRRCGEKKRKKGQESVKNEIKRLRVSGLEHTNYKGALKPLKNPPNAQVGFLITFNLKYRVVF